MRIESVKGQSLTRQHYLAFADTFGIRCRWWWSTKRLKGECEKIAILMRGSTRVGLVDTPQNAG